MDMIVTRMIAKLDTKTKNNYKIVKNFVEFTLAKISKTHKSMILLSPKASKYIGISLESESSDRPKKNQSNKLCICNGMKVLIFIQNKSWQKYMGEGRIDPIEQAKGKD